MWCGCSPSSIQAHVLLPSCISINACDNSEQGGMGADPVEPSSLSETVQAEQLSKKAGHTRTSVSLRNRDENLGAFFGGHLSFCEIKQVIK